MGAVSANLGILGNTLPQVTEKLSQINGKIQALNEASEAATTAAKELKEAAATNTDGKMAHNSGDDKRMKSMEWKLMCVLCMNGFLVIVVLLGAVVSLVMK